MTTHPVRLLQCADITLSSTASIDSSIACTNATGDVVHTLSSTPVFPTGSATTGTTPTPSSTSSGAPTTSPNAASVQGPIGWAGCLSLVAMLVSFL